MSSYRLYKWQIDRMKKSGNASNVLRSAVSRWRSGEIVIQKSTKDKTEDNVLQVFPFRNRFDGITDAKMRDILTAHFTNKVNFRKEISRLDGEIRSMMKAFLGVTFIDGNTGKPLED